MSESYLFCDSICANQEKFRYYISLKIMIRVLKEFFYISMDFYREENQHFWFWIVNNPFIYSIIIIYKKILFSLPWIMKNIINNILWNIFNTFLYWNVILRIYSFDFFVQLFIMKSNCLLLYVFSDISFIFQSLSYE